jgi:hypothetical protein
MIIKNKNLIILIKFLMEYDIILKNYLRKDNSILKIESKLKLDFLKCKYENCYSNDLIKNITNEDYEECKGICESELRKLSNLRNFIYEDFSNFYYKKFLKCSNEKIDDLYVKCLENNKKEMAKNIEDIKEIIKNFISDKN